MPEYTSNWWFAGLLCLAVPIVLIVIVVIFVVNKGSGTKQEEDNGS